MAFLRPFFIFLRLCPAWVAGALLLSGCDQGPSTRVIDVRMRELEDKIKLLEKRTDSAMLAAETGSQDLINRIESAEQKGTEAVEQTSAMVTETESRFQRIEQSLTNVIRTKEESEAVAYLDPTSPGHRTLQTDHGTFLVRLEGFEKNPLGGFNVELNVGNPMGLEIQEYRLKGDFGQPAPKLNPGEAYSDFSKRLDEWQTSLTPFEQTLTDPILPNAWSRVILPLNAGSEDALKLIRVAMVIQRARLANQEGSEGEFSVINADSDGAGLVKTDYGPLLMTVTGMEPEGTSTRVNVMVGNPFGFVINEGMLTGQFGPSPPRKMETEAPALYQKRLQIWSEQMEDFQTRFSGSIAPLRWSQASFTLPTTDQNSIKYLRIKLQVSNITLPKQSGSTNPGF
ncbi:MAG: hypothetical protein KDN19_11865 [Verrucomicrobiae bacterium]|nr:hypothetical protein [Verrucomicrobiae bacterium]